ncbi:bacteriocin, partial [Salmonella enterica subsp. enterica serovar Pomona]|nr:bacteriocin [Salmonella enterica subsp. enterica serovar Pomona]
MNRLSKTMMALIIGG